MATTNPSMHSEMAAAANQLSQLHREYADACSTFLSVLRQTYGCDLTVKQAFAERHQLYVLRQAVKPNDDVAWNALLDSDDARGLLPVLKTYTLTAQTALAQQRALVKQASLAAPETIES